MPTMTLESPKTLKRDSKSYVENLESDYLAQKQQPDNAPDIVRTSFLRYLKQDFPYERAWTHPITQQKFECALIKEKLKHLKEGNRTAYKALWALWTTSETRAFLAERLNFSGSTIRRLWDRGIDKVLLMLIHPELDPGVIILYDDAE